MKRQHLEAFTVTETGKQNYWNRVGVAFPDKSGGFTVQLFAVPVPDGGKCTIVVRPPKAKVADPSVIDTDPAE